MKDGIHRISLRDGRIYVVQIAQGRAVEVMFVGTYDNPPKRRTRKWIAGDFVELAAKAEARRMRELVEEFERLAELRTSAGKRAFQPPARHRS